MFKDAKIKHRLIFSFILIVIISSISGIIGTIQLVLSDINYSSALVESVLSQSEIGTFNTYLNKEAAIVRDVIFLEDAADVKLAQEELQQNEDKTTLALNNLKKYCHTDEELKYITAIDNKLPQYYKITKEVVDLGIKFQNNQALELFRNQAKPILNEVMTTAESLADLKVTMEQELSNLLTKKSYSVIRFVIIVITVSIIVSIIFSVYIAKSFSEPLTKVQEASAQLAQGNLSINLDIESKDEIGQMSNSFMEATKMLQIYVSEIRRGLSEIAKGNFNIHTDTNFKGDFKYIENSIETIINSLSTTLGQITEASNQVSEGSTQMAERAQNLSEGSTQQAAAIEELQATIANIVEQIENNAKDSKETFNMAKLASKEAENSRKEMDDMNTAIQQISETSKQIGNIIGEIESIASQTNLLALNAAIEAASAGEAGKGFAVVADQIRKLANDSSESASNTRKLIEASMKEVENGNQITTRTIDSLKNMIKEIIAVAENSKKISEEAKLQEEAIHQIEEGINEISGVVQSNSAIAEETSATSEELSAQSTNLNELINQFKLRI